MTVQHAVPEASYTLAVAERDGLPAIAMLNLAYIGFEQCGDFPWLLSLSIELAEQNDKGLPSDEEAEVLNNVEDAIEAALVNVTPFHHIARQSWNGTRVVDYYVERGDEAQERVETLLKSGALSRNLQITLENDPEWSSWLPMLQEFA